MAQQIINVGTAANDGTGDPVRTAFQKAKDNFAELYGGVPPAAHAASHSTGGTDPLTPANIGAAAAAHTHGVAELTATGTRDATTVLHGDNTWKAPSASGSVPVQDEGVQVIASPTALNFTGDGVGVTDVGGVATINIPGAAPGGGGGTAGDWAAQTGANALLAALGDGNPITVANMMRINTAESGGPTPSNIGTTTGRCTRFRLPKALDVSSIKLPGQEATTGLYKFAIYRASDGALMWESGAVDSLTFQWVTITPVAGSCVLAANVDYWWVVGATALGTTNGFWSPKAYNTAYPMDLAASPFAGRSIGLPQHAQITIAAGSTFPATLPALASPSWGTSSGTVPFALLLGTAS